MSRGRGGGNYSVNYDSPVDREHLEHQKANQVRRSESVWNSNRPLALGARMLLVVGVSGMLSSLWQASGWFPPLGVFLLIIKAISYGIFWYRHKSQDQRYAFASCSLVGMILGISLNLLVHDLSVWANGAINSLLAMF